MPDHPSSKPLRRPEPICAGCGGTSPATAPGGLCPRCLLGAGVELLLAETEMKSTGAATPDFDLPRPFGDYELLEEIARGGMGVVFRARQLSLNRVVALKMMLFGQFSSDEFVRRFQAEAAAAATLQHPNIVAIHEIGECDGMHYFSMDYVEGRSLAEIARERPLPARAVAAHLQVLAQAVHYAHQRGVLHRDLKPSNVLIDASGNLRLTDFGLAKRLGSGSDFSFSGQLVGSPNYMPPEQAARDGGPVGPASDVYSLGAILYHLLTGRPPIVADSLEGTLLAVLQDEPMALRSLNRGVPRDLETICLKCLQKNPSRRYPTAEALAEDLGRYRQGKPIRARPTGWIERLVRWCRRKPAAASAVALLGLITGGSALTAHHLSRLNQLARWNTYVSEMSRAEQEWQQHRFAEAFFLLERQIPRRHEPDLRGFEWRHLWELARGNCASRLPSHPDVVSWLGFSPNGKSFATFGWDATNGVQIWDATNQRLRCAIRGATSVGGFSADGELFLAGRADQSIVAHSARTGAPLTVIPQAGDIVAFAPEAQRVVTMDARHVLSVRDARTGRALLSLANSARRFFDVGRNAPVAITPDGRWLALVRPGDPSESRDRGIDLWNLDAGVMQTFLPQPRQIRLVRFSSGSDILAVANGDGEVVLWNWRRNEARSLQAHALPVQSLAFSADGATLATGSSDETIKLWDVRTLARKPDLDLTGRSAQYGRWPFLRTNNSSRAAAATCRFVYGT